MLPLALRSYANNGLSGNDKRGTLPFAPDAIGAHWSRQVQVDVVAIHWESSQILLGECKWGGEGVDRQVVRELIEEKGPTVRSELPDKGAGWTLHYAVFARAGFTDAAIAEINARGGLAVDLQLLDAGLSIVG